MNRAFTPLERKSIIACCGLSLLLFFFPLLTIHVPIAGDQDVSGYDALSKFSEFRKKLTSSSTPSSDTTHTVDRAPLSQKVPLSVQIAWLIPTALTLAFLSAAVALVASFKDVEVTRTVCIIGVCCSAVAILHITIMNSDIQSWLSESMNTARTELKDNPFPGLAQSFGALLAIAFQIRPGWSLYALLVLLSVAAVLGFSRVLSRLRIV
jgi:hypothetical protein